MVLLKQTTEKTIIIFKGSHLDDIRTKDLHIYQDTTTKQAIQFALNSHYKPMLFSALKRKQEL